MERDAAMTDMVSEGGVASVLYGSTHLNPQTAHILLIDTDEDMRDIGELLRQQNYDVTSVVTGEEAVAVANSNKFDLLIADITAPSLAGFGLLNKLRCSTDTANMSVILVAEEMSAHSSIETLGAAADDYIVKPFSDGELLARVASQLKIAAIRQHGDATLRASELRYRRLFEAAHDGILILDADTLQITDVNPFLVELLEYPRQYFIGKELWELGMFKDKADSLRAINIVRSHGSMRYENMPLLVQSGRQHPVEVVANIYCEDHHLVIQCNIRDIRDRIKLQFEREALLGREQASRAEAEAANQMKDLFLATLSHELRTPLNAIIGWTGILREQELPPEEVTAAIEVIHRNAWSQAQLIDDLLDISSIISGKLRLEIEPCELASIIQSAITTVSPAADAKQIQLTTEIDQNASLGLYDCDRMQQVMWNLLANAIKFTPPRGQVVVGLSRVGTDVKITVSDTGAGMSSEFLPMAFDRFRQADSGARRRSGGLGLGLSIVKHIVEMHGGIVDVASEGEGKGSKFTITLPVRAIRMDVDGDAPAPEPKRRASDTPGPQLSGLHVLVVDDEADARKLLTKCFELAGAIVISADSALEAIRILGSETPDVLVSDLGMPEMDGFDLIKHVRKSGRNAKTLPAVALTAFAGKKDARKALQAGFQVHVAKPVDPQNLVLVVASIAGLTGFEATDS